MTALTECVLWPRSEPSPTPANPTVATTWWIPDWKVRLPGPPWSFSPPLERKPPALKAVVLICKDLGHDLFTHHAALEKF